MFSEERLRSLGYERCWAPELAWTGWVWAPKPGVIPFVPPLPRHGQFAHGTPTILPPRRVPLS